MIEHGRTIALREGVESREFDMEGFVNCEGYFASKSRHEQL